MISDERIRAACEGDKEAIELVTLWLYRILTPIVRQRVSEFDQGDVQHQALQAVLRKMAMHAPRDAKAFEGWAKSYAHMEVTRHWGKLYRRLGHRAAYGRTVRARPKTTWFSQQQHERQQQLLRRFLRKLATLYRSPIEHHLRGDSDRSYARKRNLALGTVRWRRLEGRRRIREMIAAYLREATRAPTTSFVNSN